MKRRVGLLFTVNIRNRLCAPVLFLMTIGAGTGYTQGFHLLYTFSDAFGVNPEYGLLIHNGSLYGTTVAGGDFGMGTVFAFNLATRQEKVLHSFSGSPDGAHPISRLTVDSAGNLYGTTDEGGDNGFGTVFKLDPAGTLTVLHSFTLSDGAAPEGGVVRDPAGNLYGASRDGGVPGYGTVYKLDAAGKLTTLHEFTGPDGATPKDNLLLMQGTLYGTTSAGGTGGYGVVFAVPIKTGREKVIYSFTGASDGSTPYGGLVGDGIGNLYGTTCYGGGGYGVVFKLNTVSGLFSVLYTFDQASGANPYYVGLIRDTAGNLYGTTEYGGAAGQGTVFQLDPQGKLTTFHDFTGSSDGAVPLAGLVRDSKGRLYGTTSGVGTSSSGTLFAITP